MYELFRVYDNEEKCWVKDNVYLSPDGELFLIKRSVFGWTKLPLALSQERYVYHRTIDLWDKNNVQIHEGDYIQAQVDEDKSVIGLVAFATELSAYVILCVDSDEFYTLGSEVMDLIQVIGNAFDGYKEVVQNGEQALRDSEG